ncbi:hypothetical protein F5Y11DRAFT_181172 [Daldinia sp. FL1419]|nr:hypothetical protein F5Y11DRAFT_181172 [Daldinia sp. FL1419]
MFHYRNTLLTTPVCSSLWDRRESLVTLGLPSRIKISFSIGPFMRRTCEALALLLAGYLEKEHDPDDAISRSILGLFEVRAPRVNGIKADALRWKDPKMPMSWLKTIGLYISLFILVGVRRVLNIFTRRDLWNVRDAVKKYLAQ